MNVSISKLLFLVVFCVVDFSELKCSRAGGFQHQNQDPVYRWGKCDSASGKQVWWFFVLSIFPN
jgi:hypothetical protein